MIYTLYRRADGTMTTTNLTHEGMTAARDDREGMLWIDLVEEPLDRCREILESLFDFHPLAVEDALIDSHVPKVDDWESYVYLVLHAVAMEETQLSSTEFKLEIDTLELDCFLGANFLVTYQATAIKAISQLRQKLETDTRVMARGATYVLHMLADTLVVEYMQAMDKLDDQVDWIEDRVFNNPTPDLPEKIFTLRRALLQLRRILAPQREVLNKLARGDFSVIDESGRIYFRDVYDHLVRMHDITEGLRDLIGSALDTYLSVINNRMNDVMKVLTVITTLFMPMSFLAGFFGMNFFQPTTPFPGWTGEAAFIIMLLLMLVSPVSLYLWMRRRAWL